MRNTANITFIYDETDNEFIGVSESLFQILIESLEKAYYHETVNQITVTLKECEIDGVHFENLQLSIAARFTKDGDVYLVTTFGDVVNVSDIIRTIKKLWDSRQ